MILLLVLGLGVGLVSSLLGIGGGIFLVPLLPGLTGWNAHQVVAFTLLIILGNSLANLYWYHKQRLVNWSVLQFWGPFAAMGSFLGSYASVHVESKNLNYAFLAVVFFMMLKFCSDFFTKWENKKLFVSSNWTPLKGIYGLFVGTLSGFCGVGTGLMSSLLFMSRRWVFKDQVAPTGNGVMAFVSFSSILSFVLYGEGRSVDLAFLAGSWLQAALIMLSVFVTSFFARPFNPLISDNLRFVSLMGALIFVFGYVLQNLL